MSSIVVISEFGIKALNLLNRTVVEENIRAALVLELNAEFFSVRQFHDLDLYFGQLEFIIVDLLLDFKVYLPGFV